jgi:hypothetical protein
MIQVDMFEVQLGAALLLQFKTSRGRIVRVLADAGVRASNYRPDHVLNKLTEAFDSFGSSDRHIDLIIGTHYDEDHLEGLVPIIEDSTISITEAWLPPVANDTELHAFDRSVAEGDFLARQFYAEADHQRLIRYLEAKRRICEQVRPRADDSESLGEPGPEWTNKNVLEVAPQIFKRYLDEALESLGLSYDGHADDECFNPQGLRELLRLVDRRRPWRDRFGDLSWFLNRDESEVIQESTSSVATNSPAAHSFAWIRKAAAKQAINATSLDKVVTALRKRNVPIACHTIPNGEPRRFVWRMDSGRFEGGANLRAQGPVITLLGPSEGLVRAHWNRLPIGTYAAFARLALIPLENTTPSNELSYVVRFDSEEQGILVTGDAGCVDFKPNGRQPYYPDLLNALLPLHVVQVAHHAGRNHHFYRVLLEAKYGRQRSRSYLLLSHATRDRTRPSSVFREFMEKLRSNVEVVRLLFTSRPILSKVRDFKPLIYPAVGAIGEEGDVRLAFGPKCWAVKQHAIDINKIPPARVPSEHRKRAKSRRSARKRS